MYKVLLIEDDEDINQVNAQYLQKHGFDVTQVTNSEDTVHSLNMHFDCIVMDVMLQNEDGFSLCRKIKQHYKIPIIFLTNLGDEINLEHGFHSGGDDYIVKPYRMKELQLRIIARIESYQGFENHQKVLLFPPLKINLSSRTANISDHRMDLTASEFDILVLLANEPNTVFNISEIYQKVWKMPDIENAQTVQVHIAHLRKKMAKAYKEHSFIQTVWGNGYKFVPNS